MNYNGEFKFPVDNKWKRLYFYEEALGRGIILDDDFDGRIIDRAGNFVGGYKWQSIAQEFGDGLVAGIKDDRAGYYDKDGVLKAMSSQIKYWQTTSLNFLMVLQS